MNFCRSIYRKWFVLKRKNERKNEKKLRRGSVHNLLTSSLQNILLSAAGITMFAAPLLGATQSQITALGNQTKISYDDAKKTHTITTTLTKGDNAFNAFKSFTLHSNEIANLKFPDNTKNLLNFVKNKINIEGTLNAVKNSKIGGNLYFLSSEGLILGKGGVINAGAFYAMTPTKGFMDKFIGKDTLSLSRVDKEIGYIVDRKISNHNAAYDYGVTINPYGEIQIEGKINTINGIGLYAGGFGDGNNANKKGLYIGKDAVLNSLDASGFSSVVNVSGLSLPQATDIVENGGEIELVSVQDNTHNSSKILELATGYTSFITASAAAKIESYGTINSRSDVSLTAYASNGHVKYINKKGEKSEFDQVANIADIYSTVVVNGNINADGDISIDATSDNINELKTPNLAALGLELMGTTFSAFPLNIDANVLVSKTKSNIDIRKDAKLEAEGAIEIAATTNSTEVSGAKTSSFVTTKAASSNLNWLPIIATAVNISEASSNVNFDGNASSNMAYEAPVGDKRKKSITITSESNSDFSVDTKASSSNSQSASAIAVSVGKHKNTSTLTLGKNAKLEGVNDIEISSTTNSDNSVCAESSLKKTAYVVPAVAVSIFDSEATLNVESKIDIKKQKGELSLSSENNINSDELVADAGIPASPWPWQDAASNAKKKALDTLYDKLGLASKIQGAIPQAQAAKFSVAGAVAYGGGKHTSNLNIKQSASIKTLGDLSLSSNMNIMDTKYDVSSDIYLCDDHGDAKFETSIAFLYSDYDYSSTILIDDSSNPKTQISGKDVSIESSVYQPYRRPEAMVEDLKSAWKKVEDYFDGSSHAELAKRVGKSFDKLFTLVKDPLDMTSAGNAQQAGQVWREVTDVFDSLYELIKKEAIVTKDGIIGRLIDTVKKALEFKEYSNYVNYTVSSSSNTTEAGNDQPFSISGSVFYGDNTSKSNIFIGQNAVINGASDNSIDINSKADVTTTTMVGGIPVLYQNNQAKNSIGGSVIIHNNDSESNILVANGASIGNAELDEIGIYAINLFKPIEITMGTSSITNGFNAMGSVLNGNSYSNIRLDDGVTLAADTIKLDAYNNTEASNIVGALTISEKKGVGVGLAITLLDKETQVLIQDNDEYWQNIRNEKKLSKSSTSTTNKIASISADIFEAVAKTTGTINTIGVAGGVAIDDKSKYDKFTSKINMVNDFISGSTIDSGTDILKYKLLGKILGVNNQNQNIPDQEQQEENEHQAQQEGAQQGNNQPSLSLSINGSAAANKIKNTTKVKIDRANIFLNDGDDSSVNVSAINSAHHLSFAGAAGLMAQGDNGAGKSVGVDGSVAVNNINNTTETLVSNSTINDAKQVNATAINGGESIAAALGLQVIVSSQHSQNTGSGAINGSVNLIDNTVSAKVKNTNASSSGSGNNTNMVVAAYEADTQVTGGISAAVGKQKGGVGLSIDVAKIDNNLTAEIDGGKMTQMKNVEVNALQASTIVNAGIALALSVGVDQGSFGVSGSGVYTELNNTNSANIKNATINSDAVSVRTEDVRTSDSGVKTYNDNLERNAKDVSFIDKEGKEFYTGLDTATGTTELGELASSRKGSLLVTAAISGAYGGTAVGLGAAINEIENTYNVNVDKSDITTKKFNANAKTHTDAITVGIGASVSSEANKGSGAGSAGWNSIKNEANVTFSNNTIKSESLELKSLNDASLVGVGGQFSVSKGYAAIGASVAYNSIENTASSKLYGGSVTGVATNSSKLSVNSENTANIWGIAVSVEAAKNLAVGGTVVLNEIDNNATSSIGDSSTFTKIASIKDMNVLATDSADIKGLSGAVTASKKVSIGGAVTVNHIEGETAAKLNNTTFNALNSNVRAYSESNNLSLALGCGGAGTFAFDGAAVNNDIFRDVYTKVEKSTTDNATGTFNTSATAIGNTGSLAAVVLGAGKVSIGAGVSVNRMGGKVQTTLDSNNFKLKNLSAISFSNQDITTIGIAGSGAGVSISGSIAYNAIEYNTIAEILNSTLISATNNIAVKAISDDTIKNYAGVLSLGIGIPDAAGGAGGIGGAGAGGGAPVGGGAAANRNKFLKLFDTISGGLKSGHDNMGTLSSKMGGVGVGVSVSVNKIDGKTNAKVSGGNVTAQGKDSNDKVKLNNQIADSDINNAYMDSSTVDIRGSLADKRKETTKTGLIVDSSSTHTAKSFLASVSGAGKAAVNANVNVNYIGGETNSIFENATVNKGLNGKTAGNVNVNANDYTNTAGFIGNVAFGGNAGIGLSADTNKVVRDTNARVSGIKDGSVANNLEVKANSKQGISSVVAGLAASLKVGVAGNIDVALLDSTTKAIVENSKISVNSLDVEANHFARSHELAVAAGIGAGTAGVGAAVVVNNDINTVSATVASSTINVNSGASGAFKVNSKNDDDFETVSGAGGAGMYAGVAGAVAVNYMENNVETTVASSTFGTSANRAGSVEIKAKDLSKQVSKGGSVGIGGYAGVGAVVEVNTLDGQTNTNITDSKIYANKDIELGSSEQRDSEQFAVSVSAGLAGVGANVLVINSGKKMDLSDSGSNDANSDTNKALGMADEAVSSDYNFNSTNTFSAEELKVIFGGKPTYVASKDGKAVTLTKIDKSIIDSKSGKVTSNTVANGTLNLSNNGGAGGAGAVLGCFGYVYDNKNVVTSLTNSHINAGNGIEVYSTTGGKSELSLVDAVAGIGDYAGAFGNVKMAGNTSIGIAGSRLINNKNHIRIIASDEASGKADSRGYTFGGVGIGTIIARAKNDSSSDVTVSNSRIANNGNYTASNSITISAEKANSLSAIGYSGTISGANVSVVSTLAQDEGKSTVKIGTGNYFVANELNALASNMPDLFSKFFSWSGGVAIGVGVGDVTTREYGTAKLNAVKGSNYKVNTVNMGAVVDSESNEISEAYTVTVGIDIHANRADTLSSSNVEVDVNIGKDDFDKNTVLNVYGENSASATMDVYGVSVGGVLSVANNSAKAIASLTTNVNVVGEGKSTLSQINAYSSSDAYHKLHANGDGGGIFSVSPYAASTESKMTLTNNTNLSKDLSANKISADAIGTAKGYLTSDATQGEAIGGCGTEAIYDYTVNSNVNVKDNAKLTADIVDLKTQNTFATGSERKDLNNMTKSYGGITGCGASSEQNINSTSQVNIGKKASILASEELNIDAKTKADLFNKIHAGGAGLGSHPGSTSKNTHTFNNNIITGEGSLLKTNKKDADINLAVSYDIKGNFSAFTEVEGAGGGSTNSTVENNITNNNKIDISGDVYSYNDINLYTDRDTDGILSKYYLNNEAEAYTKAVIPWKTNAEINNKLTRNHSINVNSKANTTSIRHTTLSVDKGDINIKNHTKEYNWYKGDDEKQSDVSTVSEGESKGALSENNKINVDGKVIAGVENKVNITIDGKVMFDKSASGDGIVRTPTITSTSDEYKALIKYGTMEYANRLYERYEEIEKLITENKGTLVGENYESEKARLIAEMEKYGLYDSKNNSLISKMPVDYVELPDMVSSGGNVYLNIKDGKKVTGKGLIQAKGAPEITVTNNSNLYMVVNDMSIIEPGGEVFLEDLALGKKAQSSLAVKEVKTDASNGSLIDVKENWEGSFAVNYYNSSTKKTEKINYTPLSNLEINGHIDNPYGQANFLNVFKDIVIQGKSAKDSASIQAAAISISAPKGSIAQGYTQGITNIGYSPEYVLMEFYKKQQEDISKGVTTNAEKTIEQNLTLEELTKYEEKYKTTGTNVNESSSGVWLAGGSIFLNGDDLNINGTVQSGYSQFEANLDGYDKVIDAIKKLYTSKGSPEVTDAYLKQYCKLNTSGMLWDNGTKTYKYVVQAYYNPQTDKIILEDISSQGGRIYLTGRISNTSNGKIFAADGSSDINITNTTGKDLVANILDVGTKEGLIRIMDLGRNKDDKNNNILATLTEMTSKDTKVWYVTSQGRTDEPNKVSGVTTEYNPMEGLTYNWTTGFQSVNEYTYNTSEDFTVWGLFDYGKKTWDTLQAKKDKGEISPKKLENIAKQSGTYVGDYTKLGNDTYQIYYVNKTGDKSKPSYGSKTVYDNWTHFSGTVYSWATFKEGDTETFKHSIKADYPIKIGFLSGNGDINVTTNSGLTLNGDITSDNSNANVKLTSTKGSIEQTGGIINADNIWLKATNGIGNDKAISQQLNSTNGVLSAITSKGNVNLLSQNKSGEKDSNLKLTATTNNGNVDVLADASLLNGAESINVKGSRIDLTSNYGSIGTSNSLLTINAGQSIVKPGDTLSASVNANAFGDVALNQTSGDMRLGKAISKTGNVYITSDGAVLDALPPNGDENVNQSAEDLIAKWKKLGIISESGKDNSAEKRKEAITAYKNSVYTAYSRYTDLKERYKTDKDTNSDTYNEYQSLKERFGSYSSADKWLEAQNKDKDSDWYKLQNDVTYGWTQDALLYAIQDSIINRESGSTITPKSASDANIKGRNIFINAGGGIGKDEGYTVVDISNLMSEDGLESLKAIAAAEASDVKWGYDGDKADKNKATISKINSLNIDSSGKLEAYAKGNIYLEDVNNNAINLISVASDEGNVRVYGSNGVYNATNYVEGNKNNTINLSGKDLILEAGNGSIGSSTVPVTTNMSGVVTLRSDGLVNIYQIGGYALTFAAAYSGADMNIRSIGDILSVYSGVKSQDLGYINAKGNITLLSDKGDIGQANGKGLRVKITDDKELAAEGNSVYIKGYGENTFNLGKISARTGDIGIDSKTLDVILKNDISSQNLEFKVRSLTQKNGKLTVSKLLNVNSDNGIDLGNFENLISGASLINNKSGNIFLRNNHDLTIYDLINKAENSNINIINEGFVTVKNGFSSNGDLFIWADGNIDIQKDSAAKKWIGLYSDNGGISVKFLKGGSIDLSGDSKGLTADDIISDTYIEGNIGEGDIKTGDLKAANGKLLLVTNNGSISSNNIEAKNDINVIAYKGKLDANIIKSIEGDIEAVGYISLAAKSIIAQNNFFVGSLGDVVINKLSAGAGFNSHISDLFDNFNQDEFTSNLIGNNIKIDDINVLNNLEAVANGNFNVNKIVIGKKASISAEKNIDINNINSGENLEITSFGEGSIKIKDIYTDKGELSISNEIGNIELENINAGNDVQINNGDNGDISIGQIKTSNEGSLYANLNDGIFCLESGVIDGEASIYSEKGNIVLTEINIDKELDVRANDGSIVVGYKTTIGGDATLKSNTNSVLLTDAEVGGNMKISAYSSAYINNAKVYGSMLMKGVVDGCTAAILEVGNDLILNTDTGSIKVIDANVGSNSYVSIDGKGKDIEISNINTGNVSTGDLIIVSNSAFEDNHTISIDNAIAANKLIINSLCSISLNSAFANNGKLEVKAGGNVFAELIKSAKETYISTLFGILEITKVISGDTLQIAAFGGSTLIKDIETLNPEADIIINQILGDISISNASSSRNLEFTTFYGGINIDTVSTAKDIKIDGFSTEININNSYAGNDINISNENGKIDINNTQIGNNLNLSFAGETNLNDVKVINKSTIIAKEDSIVNIDKFNSLSLDLKDNGQTNASINNSEINTFNVNLNGDLTINNLSNSIMSAELNGNATINNLTSDKMTAVLNGKSSISESELGNVDLTNKGESLIKDSKVNTFTATNNGNLELTTTPVNTLDLTNKSDAKASIHDTSVNTITAANDGEFNVNKLTGDNLELTSAGNINIDDSKITNINANISGTAKIDKLVNSRMSAVISGNSEINNSRIEDLDMTNNGVTTLNDNNVTSFKANNNKVLKVNALTNDSFELTNSVNTNITDSTIDKFDLSNTGESTISNSEVKNFTASNNGELNVNNLTGDNLELTSKGNTNIEGSKITSINANISGNATINQLTSSQMSSVVSGKNSINNSTITKYDLTNTGESIIKDSKVKTLSASNNNKLELSTTPVENMNLTNKSNGNASIHDSAINSMTVVNNGELIVNSIKGDELDLTSSANANINDSNIKTVNATLSGSTEINNLVSSHLSFVNSGNTNIIKSTTDSFKLSNTGKSTIKDSKVKTMLATNDGNLEITTTPVESMNLTNRSNGNASIHDSTVNSMTAVNDGELKVNNITSDKLKLTSAGNTNIEDSKITNINANIIGEAELNRLTTNKLVLNNSGNTNVSNTATNKINITNSGKTSLNNIDVKDNANVVNKNGNLNIDQLDVANNFDIDSNSGSINMSGIDIKNDFNFALAGNSGVKFTDITIENDFNVYAGKAVLKGASLNVGNNLNTYTYSKYSALKATMRAAVSSNSGNARASESEEGFSLILDQLNIGGGLYVDNPDVTIKVKESQVGHDVKIDAGKENIQIDKLDVDGGNLDIKGTTGSIKLGEIKVDNDTKINLGSGNLEVSDLNSKQEIDFNVGGNITSDKNIETQNKSVNMIAGGSVDAYKVLAKDQGNIEAVNGDIIIGQIDGKTLVFKQDSNDRTLRIREANVETKVTAGADYIDIDLINQTSDDDRLGIDFTRVNGRAMDNVVIGDVKTNTGVNMFNLFSTYATIHVSNEIFNLKQTYLLKKGDLSNTSLKFRLYGDNPKYSREPDIIAFFAPMINHKSFADISFTNEWKPEKQDYYPLTAKGDYRRMFNQYTVVQDFETLRLAYEEIIKDYNDDAIERFNFRKVNHSKAFFVDNSQIQTNGDVINLDDFDIPVGVEFDSASGELKSVGSHVKPQRAMD